MLTLDVNSLEESNQLIDEIPVAEINQILDENMEFLINLYMVPEIKRVAMSANIPRGFVEGVVFVKTGNNEGLMGNTWGSEELPLAKWFNYGTRDHGSKGNWPLHWKSKNTGKDIYAMWVRGVPKTLAMEIGMALGHQRLMNQAPKFVERRLR